MPTMGALHDGHLALVPSGQRRAARVVATIFVNPLQFDQKADLERYPRQEEADLATLEAAGCDAVWLPGVEEIYPPGFATTVSVRGLSRPLGGRVSARPFRRRGDGGGETADRDRARCRDVRREGLAATGD